MEKSSFQFSVSISKDLKNLLDELSALSGCSSSRFAAEILEQSIPALRKTVLVFRRIDSAKQQCLLSIEKGLKHD